MSGAIHFAVTHSSAGGLRELWDDLAEGLAERGHRVARFALYPPADPEGEGVDRSRWHHIAPVRPRGVLAGLRLVVALVRYLRRERPAVIVTAMPAANVLLPIAVALARVPTRIVLSHHSPTDTHNPHLERIDGWTGSLPSVAAVVSVSDAVAATLAHKPARYRAKRVTIHNALSRSVEQLVDSLAARAATPDPGRCRIVALGRLTAQKNYPMLIRAVAAVPQVELELIGAGEDEAMLRTLAAELGAAERIRFTGWLPRAAALERAAAADLFAQVSRYEGHSLALVEAARLGLPLIVSDVPVQIEGVTARDGTCCGHVVPLDDVAVLATVIAALAQDPAARRDGAARARRLGREASHDRMLDRYEAVLAPLSALR